MDKQPEQQHGPKAPHGAPGWRARINAATARDILPLLAGFALALLVGWAVFPQLLHTSQAQPVAFSHVAHLEQAGLDCKACHYLRADGSFAGRPSLENCAECHSAPLSKDPEERRLISEYIGPGKEISWLSYASQPDHVFFSHAAHGLERCNACHQFAEVKLCARCHQDMSVSAELPAYVENRITGYSQDTMDMRACERCHALPGHAPSTASNNCAVCHK